MPFGKRAEAAVEGARDMADSEDERRLVRVGKWLRIARQRAETGRVVGIRLDSLGKRHKPVQLSRAARRDRGYVGELSVRDLLCSAGRVVLGAHVRAER